MARGIDPPNQNPAKVGNVINCRPMSHTGTEVIVSSSERVQIPTKRFFSITRTVGSQSNNCAGNRGNFVGWRSLLLAACRRRSTINEIDTASSNFIIFRLGISGCKHCEWIFVTLCKRNLLLFIQPRWQPVVKVGGEVGGSAPCFDFGGVWPSPC